MRTQHTSNTARRRSWRLAPWFALMLGVFIALGVTQAPTARAEPPTRSAPEADEAEALKKIAVVRSMKLAEVLELGDDDQETRRKLDQVLSEYDLKLFKAEGALRRSVKRLRRGVRGELDDKELDRLSDEVIANRERVDKLRLERMKALDAILTGSQRARVMLFLPSFERKVRRAVGKARRGRRGAGRDLNGPPGRRKGRPRRSKP